MSQYVNRMGSVLVSLNTAAQKIHADMDRNTANLKPDVAADENARLQAELNKAASEARTQIDAIREDAAAAARKWGEPAGAEIDAGDLALLKGDFQLSQETLWNLLVKHQNNGTMVNAISKYAKEHDVILDYIPNVEDKLFAYDSFAKSANGMIGDIVHSIGLAHNDLTLAKWGEPGNISQRMELVLYGIKKKEDPSAKLPDGNFNFGFKPLEGRGN